MDVNQIASEQEKIKLLKYSISLIKKQILEQENNIDELLEELSVLENEE